MPRLPRIAALDLGLCAAFKAAATALAWRGGFRAISDDDYARVAIAERFAASPTLDPTGSSWLPFPFYGYGAALRLFGSSLTVARGVALLAGVLSTLLVLLAARLLGLERRAALVAALLGALLPYSVYLGAATVPEAFTAALMLFACAALVATTELRLTGAAALFLASGSRYEAWPLAFVFAAFSAIDAWKARSRWLAVSALLALAFPLLWLLHGAVRHHDPLFFVARVQAYRDALGPDDGFVARLLRAPRGLLSGEPEITLAALAALGWRLHALNERRAWLRFTLPLFAVVGFLVLGDLRGAAPTHHGERALLSLWLAAAILVSAALEAVTRSARGTRAVAAGVALAALALGFMIRRAAPRAPFIDRALAEDIGDRARRVTTHLAIDAPDYGFFAIQAAFGRPQSTLLLDDRDPRKPRPPDWLARNPAALAERLSAEQIRWLALPSSRAPLAHSIARVSEGNSQWLLLELRR